MLMSSFLISGLARMEHMSTPTAKASWFGSAAMSPFMFSKGIHPTVPVVLPLVSPRPVAFTTSTRVLYSWVPGCVFELRGCQVTEDNANLHMVLLFAPY